MKQQKTVGIPGNYVPHTPRISHTEPRQSPEATPNYERNPIGIEPRRPSPGGHESYKTNWNNALVFEGKMCDGNQHLSKLGQKYVITFDFTPSKPVPYKNN